MPNDFYAEVTAILRDAGCQFIRPAKGSHELWYSPLNGRRFVVPRSKSRHTANEVLKQAGLSKRL